MLVHCRTAYDLSSFMVTQQSLNLFFSKFCADVILCGNWLVLLKEVVVDGDENGCVHGLNS